VSCNVLYRSGQIFLVYFTHIIGQMYDLFSLFIGRLNCREFCTFRAVLVFHVSVYFEPKICVMHSVYVDVTDVSFILFI